jgi:hypothetical protein
MNKKEIYHSFDNGQTNDDKELDQKSTSRRGWKRSVLSQDIIPDW